MRRFFMTAIVAFYTLFGATAYAQLVVANEPEPQAGKEYIVLPVQVPTTEPSKIEVTEVFWYGCGHCYALEPVINKWAIEQPEDVHFVRLPGVYGKTWTIHGQLFLTLDTLGVEEKLHAAVFDSIQNRRNLLLKPEDMATFVEGYGINREKFLETFNSFGVQTKLEKTKKLFTAYGLNGVPSIIVNGKYRVDINENVGTPQAILKVTNYLIQKERNALKADTAETDSQLVEASSDKAQ